MPRHPKDLHQRKHQQNKKFKQRKLDKLKEKEEKAHAKEAQGIWKEREADSETST